MPSRNNRIQKTFRQLKKRRRKAVIFYITSGFPSLKGTERLMLELQNQGTDLIEVGVPFSDPLADGPTIQNASVRALARGTTLAGILRMIRRIRGKMSIPLVIFSYYNPIYHMGLAEFARRARQAGVDGVIVPDLPPEEGEALARALRRRHISLIFLLSPTSPLERIRLVARRSRGFIYYVSRTGVTGARKSLERDLRRQVARVKRHTRLPVVIGFGVSGPAQAARAAAWADGIVVGSALIEQLGRPGSLKKAGAFAGRIARAVRGSSQE